MVPHESNVKLPPILHIGQIVKDLDKTVEFYNSCGLGPFRVYELELKGCMYRGKPSDSRLKIGTTSVMSPY